MHTNTIIWQWCTVCAQNSFDLIYRLLWTPKSATILDHKPRQRKTGATNQKHLSCERFFFFFFRIFFFLEGGYLLKCDGHPPTKKKHPLNNFFFFPFSTQLGSESFYRYGNHPWESSNTWPHQEPKPYQRDGRDSEGGGGWGTERNGGDRWRREDGENGQRTTTSNRTPHIRKMDEGDGRLQFIPSSAPNFSFPFCSSGFLLFLVVFLTFHSFSGLQILIFSFLTVSHTYLHHLLRFPLLIAYFFPPMSHFAFVPPHSSSFSLSTFHLFPACASLCKTQISKKWSAKSFFYSVLPSFTCKNNCNNNLSNSIIKCFLSVPALPPSPPSLIITVQIHQITKHVFYVKP